MDDYVSKPVQPEKLYTTLLQWKGDVTPTLTIAETANNDTRELEVLGLARLEENCGGDSEFVCEVLQMFSESLPDTLARLAAAIEAEDAAQVNAEAHSAKGAARTVCADAVGEAFFALERAGKQNALSNANALLLDATGAAARVQSAIALYLEGQERKAA